MKVLYLRTKQNVIRIYILNSHIFDNYNALEIFFK